jgi:orotate phosphoribosyltransferase
VCGPLLGGAFLAQAIASSIGVRFYYSELVASSDAALLVTKYQLPVALRSLVRGERVAVVDDVISAGSSVRATVAALTDAGASISAVAAFMVLGDVGWDHFVGHGMPIETLQRRKFEVWAPEQCPSCRSGTKLEDPREPASPSVS